MNYVLDACAMIAFLGNEVGADIVVDCLNEPGARCHAHAINLCEVYYDAHRRSGEQAAREAIDDLLQLGVLEHAGFERGFREVVGNFKAVYKKGSLADFCAVALTKEMNATLLTSDHKELDPIAAAGICNIRFIR